jgi:hypothetical protein
MTFTIGVIIIAILVKVFGWDRGTNIAALIIGAIPIALIIGFFVFFVLPSQFWQNL